MHIVLISQCDQRAIKRTARVLDAYAHRQGDRTWMTPITREGLQTLHSVLRAGATRQTAVACYVSHGLRQMRLAWVVGAKHRFGPNGVVAVATRKRASNNTEVLPAMPVGWRIAALLARLSGYLHDLGKFGVMFQDKLAGTGPMADAVRHEWLSLHVIQELKHASSDNPLDRLSTSWDAAWSTAAKGKLNRISSITTAKAPLSAGLRDAWSTLLFLVFTHHRLPGDQGHGTNMLSDAAYIDDSKVAPALAKVVPVASPSSLTVDLVKKTASRLAAITSGVGTDPLFWRAVATVARMGLILSDHSVSSADKTNEAGHGPDLQRRIRSNQIKAAFANTIRLPDGTRSMNQELNWHLQNVGDGASEFVSQFARFTPAGLSDAVLANLRAPTTGRFVWQGQSADMLRAAQASENLPTLVFNVAGTGCGKTRMNAVAVAALREIDGPDGSVRFATALNLRTLTLQTRDAYATQLGMGDDELACVIGSSIAKLLHEARTQESKQIPDKKWGIDEDGNPPEESFEVLGGSSEAPAWLEHFLVRKPKMRPVVMSPVLVCTIDHLIKAGEPTEQGNHALTNLRLMTSDLVLDEIDSYDPKALVAVMRLITSAAFWGRHVIASSATLSLPVALGVWVAYKLGADMRAKLLGTAPEGRFRVGMLDDKCPSRTSVPQTAQEFHGWFTTALQEMLKAFGRTTHRPSELAQVSFAGCKDIELRKSAVLSAIDAACHRMHVRHRWTVVVDGKPHQISIGLVRIANINRAVEVARHLCASHPDARIACYHSQLPRIGRFILERSLDNILTRKTDQDGPHQAPEIHEAVRRARLQGRAETMFIVVATPVEEIGRDHDFDWAVIEPSSVQSIVQTVGRVNRHRLVDVTEPNIAVLQFNFRHAEKGSSSACFIRPGLENKAPYPSHDLDKLLDWKELSQCGQIDARTRFMSDKHSFAKLDNQSTFEEIGKSSERFLNSERMFWMGRDTYADVPLREPSLKKVISQDEHGVHHEEHRDGPQDTVWLKTQVIKSPRLANDWLVWSFDDCLVEAQRLGITSLDAFAVEVWADGKDGDNDRKLYIHHESMGYFLYSK